MKKVLSLFAGSAERRHDPKEQIASAEDRYYWWFDHPVDWARPARTLYITGWCVSRYGKKIRSIRAWRGRQKFLGNYGAQRKDVGAALEQIGFAVAVPLPRGRSQVVIEIQEGDGVWRAISNRTVFGTSKGVSQAPVDPKYFVHNPG